MVSFCGEAAGILRLVGWVVTIFKVFIPLIIIVLGMFDFGKAVVAGKDDEIKEQAKKVGMRIAAGIIIFFIPSIVMGIFNLGLGDGKYEETTGKISDFATCEACILKPWDSLCTSQSDL